MRTGFQASATEHTVLRNKLDMFFLCPNGFYRTFTDTFIAILTPCFLKSNDAAHIYNLPRISVSKKDFVVAGDTENSSSSILTQTPLAHSPMQKEPFSSTLSFKPCSLNHFSSSCITSLEPFKWHELPIQIVTIISIPPLYLSSYLQPQLQWSRKNQQRPSPFPWPFRKYRGPPQGPSSENDAVWQNSNKY